MDEILLLEGFMAPLELTLNEDSSGRSVFRAKLQEAGKVNKNKRIYEKHVLEGNMPRLQELAKNKSLIGNIDHLESSVIALATASHLITKLWWDGNDMMGEGIILNTPHGKVLKTLLSDGVKVGMSSRSVGNGTTNSEGVLVIDESLRIITFDAVADPSTDNAYFEERIKKENFSYKNETRSLNIDKQKIIAAISGIIREQKERVLNG